MVSSHQLEKVSYTGIQFFYIQEISSLPILCFPKDTSKSVTLVLLKRNISLLKSKVLWELHFICHLKYSNQNHILLNVISGLWALYFMKCFMEPHLGRHVHNISLLKTLKQKIINSSHLSKKQRRISFKNVQKNNKKKEFHGINFFSMIFSEVSSNLSHRKIQNSKTNSNVLFQT